MLFRVKHLTLVAALLLSSLALADAPANPTTATPTATPTTTPTANPTATAPKKPVVVRVGLYLLNVGKVDIAAGTYTADFYLSFKSTTDMGDPRFEFMNGRASSSDKLTDTPTEKLYRIQANLMTNLDLRRYPWDEHDLPIILESATRKDDDIVFVADAKDAGLDPAVIFVGWDLKGFSSAVTRHHYAAFDEDYSQVVFRIHIARLVFITSLKTFLPVLCFLLIAFVALLVTVEKADSRVGMNTAMLIASVMFHLNITNQLPAAAYLTIADKVMIATYLTIVLSLLLSVMMMRLVQIERVDEARRLRALAFKVVPGFAAVAYAAIAFV